MALHFSVSRARRRVDAFGTGVIALADVTRYIEDRVAAGAYSFDQCVDLRAAEFAADAATLQRTVREERNLLKAGPLPPTALVATVGTPTHETARAIAASFSAEGVPIAVFSTLVQAEVWLEKTRDE